MIQESQGAFGGGEDTGRWEVAFIIYWVVGGCGLPCRARASAIRQEKYGLTLYVLPLR